MPGLVIFLGVATIQKEIVAMPVGPQAQLFYVGMKQGWQMDIVKLKS